MLIAIAIYLFSMFGGTAKLSERVEEVVADPARCEAALEVLDRIADVEAAVGKQLEESSAALRIVHMDYEASREDYLAVLGPMQEARQDARVNLEQAWGDLRLILTAQEWVEVFPPSES
ncbi:MAG: hypothetical protein ACI9F9_001860 [Candidatus Paceibacteria bacterium]|jgi:hypothetical protein